MTGAELSGTVHSEGSIPAPDAVVEILNGAGDIVDQVMVDERGRFSYHLSAGKWSLRAWDPHGRRASADVALAAGESRVTKLDLAVPERGRGQ
jgi:Carboxypeptidase regulatory-like domain